MNTTQVETEISVKFDDDEEFIYPKPGDVILRNDGKDLLWVMDVRENAIAGINIFGTGLWVMSSYGGVFSYSFKRGISKKDYKIVKRMKIEVLELEY